MASMLDNVMHNLISKPATEPGKPTVSGARGCLTVDLDNCAFCGLCQKRCPAQAITVDRAGRLFHLEASRCVLCNFCAEGCPKKCLHMSDNFRHPGMDIADLAEEHQGPAPVVKTAPERPNGEQNAGQ